MPAESADDYLNRVVDAKLAAAGAVVQASEVGVLVADTIVLMGERILGKPEDDAESAEMFSSLAGRTHEVWTRFAVMTTGGRAATHRETVRTQVTFRPLSEREIAGYVATGEGRDKAGAYAIQGVGAFAVVAIRGSYSNVVGLPACEVITALMSLGLLHEFPSSFGRLPTKSSG